MKRGEEESESGSGVRISMKKKSEKVKEEEEALLLLIDHRTREVERNTTRILQYTLQLEKSEKLLEEAKARLCRLQECEHDVMSFRKSKGKGTFINKVEHNITPCRKSMGDGVLVKHRVAPIDIFSDSSEDSEMPCANSLEDVKCEEPPVNNAFLHMREKASFQKKTWSRPQIILPAANLKPFKPQPVTGSVPPHTTTTTTTTTNNLESVCKNCRKISSDLKVVESQPKVKKRKLEQNQQKDLIALIGRSSEARTVHCQTGPFIFSQHKRRLRSLVLCPTNDQYFVTSALDGLVNLWQVHTSGSSANILRSTDCITDKMRRWPEDIAWHPRENSLFFVYSADGEDSQVAILDLNKEKERSSVNFLEDKPHVKGNINNIMFMPWDDTYFVTGGTDHAVVLWNEKDGESKWKPNALHRDLHSSAVMGVAGLQHKQIVISAGADKRISGFDILAGKADYMHQIDTKCMSILPNPFDWNLFMVQTGTPRRQLRLYDYRVGQTEIHAFGWEQEQSQSQSALIKQAWSPDGLYITSGSADPAIHIFDIRYNAQKPAQSVKAHNKRVFKAAWHRTLPILISISSDPNIGLHKIA